MRAALLTIVTIALICPTTGEALAQPDAGRAGTAAERPQGTVGAPAKRAGAQRRAAVRPSDLSDIAASMRASRPQSPGDGSSRVYVPGRAPLYCFGVGGIVTCQ